jgi:hypothetical protein
MPKIRKPLPPGVSYHLAQRYREGRVAAAGLLELKHWLESDPIVPHGKSFKRFSNFILAGNGEMPSTFLTPGMAVEGEEVQ